MAEHGRRRRPGTDPEPAVASRRRPAWLPTGRALVGGALVATAATGVLLAHRAADAPPRTRFVVAVADVDPGMPLRAEDLGTIAADLPGDVTAVPADRSGELVGRVARGPIRSMDLLRDGDLLDPGRSVAPGNIELGIDLPPAQAMSGTIRPGDRVQVMSTDPDGVGTTLVAADVLVTAVDGDRDPAIGSAGTVRLRIAVADAETARSVVDAAVRTDLTLALPAPGSDPGGAR